MRWRHVGQVTKGQLKVGETAKLKVDTEREFTRKNHTATHLLHWALHKVLGEHVEQRGSKVKPDEFTFDFSHNNPMTDDQKAEVERLVNEKVYADLPVTWRELSQDEAKKLPGVRGVLRRQVRRNRPRRGDSYFSPRPCTRGRGVGGEGA